MTTSLSSSPITWKTVFRNLERLREATLSGNPDEVADLYFSDAMFIPTMKSSILAGPDPIRNFYAHYLPMRPRLILHEPSSRMVVLCGSDDAPEAYIHSANFQISFGNGSGGDPSLLPVETIISFVWARDSADGNWKIRLHQASPPSPG